MINEYLDAQDIENSLLDSKLRILEKFGFTITLEYDEGLDELEYEVLKNGIRQYISIATTLDGLSELICDFYAGTINDTRVINKEIKEILTTYLKQKQKISNRNK